MGTYNKQILSPSWEQDFGTEVKSILNKTPILNSLPVNNSYVFFKNGAYKSIQDEQFHKNDTKFKKIYEDDYKNKSSFGSPFQRIYGPLTNRPVSFTEKKFSDIYYNSFGVNINFGSNLLGFINPLTLGALFGIPTENLMGLMVCVALAAEMTNAINGEISSAGSLIIPKMGISKMFFYEQIIPMNSVDKMLNQVINRIYPLASEQKKKIIYKDMINLCSDDKFNKNIGKLKDKILSKNQHAGGSGYMFAPYKGVSENSLKTYIQNLKANSMKKDNILKRFFGKDKNYSKYKENEDKFFENLGKVPISPIFSASSIPSYIHIDFTDYVVAKFASGGGSLAMGILSNGTTENLLSIVPKDSKYRNTYFNSKAEKSIFGPYICRSKSTWLYYPKIIIQTKGFTTGYTGAGAQIGFLGGLNIFGSAAPVQSIGSYTPMDVALLILSIAFPFAAGSVGMGKSVDTISPCLTSPPLFFPFKQK